MLSESHLKIHQDLGVPTDYGQENELPWYAEAEDLIDVGPNLVGRVQQLTPTAAASWQQMVEAASGDGVRLLMVSGYRSFEYQAQLIRNKLDSGQKIQITKPNPTKKTKPLLNLFQNQLRNLRSLTL